LRKAIDATDRQIDQFVCELYGLTDEEIKIVEEATQRLETRQTAISRHVRFML